MDHFTPKRDSFTESDSIFKTINKFTTEKSIVEDEDEKTPQPPLEEPEPATVTATSTRLPAIEDFSIIKPISRGAFGKVFLGYKNNDTERLFAIKVMKKSDMIHKNMVSQVITERNALALSRSPFCVSLFYSLQTNTSIYLVMEYMVGGDLKSLLAMYGFFDETSARFYCAEICMALEYLHEHGIVHRDIKPDNMLISAAGHVKLTDFGLSKIELSRDLEISDLISDSPNLSGNFTNTNFCHLNARTPGQLLSLTSQLSFVPATNKNATVNDTGQQPASAFLDMINRHNSSNELDISDLQQDTSKISGVNSFFSADNHEIATACRRSSTESRSPRSDSASSYYTCSSISNVISLSSAKVSGSFEGFMLRKQRSKPFYSPHVKFELNPKEMGADKSSSTAKSAEDPSDTLQPVAERLLGALPKNKHHLLLSNNNDSGISSKKGDSSTNGSKSEDSSSNPYRNGTKNENSSFDFTRSFNHENQSPVRNSGSARNFKRPGCLRGVRRKRYFDTHMDSPLSEIYPNQSSTGLTQEIDTMDIGSSTPKKRRAKSPLNGALKTNSLSDEDVPLNANKRRQHRHLLGPVLVSTPVSSQKLPRREKDKPPMTTQVAKFKATRFNLPSSDHKVPAAATGSEPLPPGVIADGITSPPPGQFTTGSQKTPKAAQTPFRTPKSVRRGVGDTASQSSERILGTPDYLAPELLMVKRHGPEVDWWALGVCMYEFMTGIPPFNDETPQKVFENILSRNIEWPQDEEALSAEAVQAIEDLLTVNPKERPAAKEVHKMRFFNDVDWKTFNNLVPPFVPSPDDPTDTFYFDAKNVMQHLKLSNFNLS